MSLNENEIASIRTDYTLGALSEESIAGNPIEQFRSWFQEAINKQVTEPNAMTLSTVSNEGLPAGRIVLLKDVDARGFSFYTNYSSDKGHELETNPNAALLFFWPELQRQVRITGKVEKLPKEVSDEYFQSRPRGSQLGALASPQSKEIVSRDELETALNTLEEQYATEDRIPKPEHWGGYVVVPSRIEFWQGRSNRLHDRLCFKLENDRWDLVRLAP